MRRRAPTGRSAGDVAPDVAHDWIDDEAGLADVVTSLRAADRYSVDTEFHRERTYWPQVALVQIAWDDELVLIDPLAVDLRPLARAFSGPGLAIMHAASQDIEVFDRAVEAVPDHLFDTQIAAGFLGYGTPSLASLVEGELGVRLTKGDRLTDWMRRPLDRDQRAYAATDVVHLEEIHGRLRDRLEARGRTAWAEAESEAQRTWRPQRDPDQAYQRIKEARQLRGRALGVARSVAAWRERRAAATDVPARHVMADLAVVSVANKAPRQVSELSGIRGLDDRLRRGALAEEIVAAVAEGLETGPPPRAARSTDHDLERRLRPAIALVSAWVAQLARSHEIDTALLATRADIEALLIDGAGRLTDGWRHGLVGAPVRDLVEGRAALAFEGDGLVLEPRDGR